MATKIKNKIIGSPFWVDSENLSFPELEQQSFVPQKWARYDLLEKEYKDLSIRPVNRYVSNLYPKPEILSINENTITLLQRTHAEIWVEPKGKDNLYSLDKCHQRQFYPSPKQIKSDNCFFATYRFYMPWVTGFEASIKINKVKSLFSPFTIEESLISFTPPIDTETYVNTPFINFNIKNVGEHMKDSRYGIIDIGSPMFEIVLTVSDSELFKIKEEYGYGRV
jgi:hypothetical protein